MAKDRGSREEQGDGSDDEQTAPDLPERRHLDILGPAHHQRCDDFAAAPSGWAGRWR